MGTTSEKLTYLNDTKQLLKENINSLGGNLTNEPFRQYASVLEGIYESLPKVSGIGASLSLSPSLMGKIKLNEIQGDTLQNGTPTPSSPVPIQSVTGLQNVGVCGKNFLNIPDGTYSNNGITAIASNGEITLNGTASATSFIMIPLSNDILLGNANKTLSLNNAQVISDTPTECRLYTSGQDYNSVNFSTINKSTTFSNDRVYTRFQIRTSSGVTFNNFVFKPQLEKGSTATSYEPYKGNTYEVNLGNIELNKIGDYDDSIKKSTGKNLFDKNNANIINAIINGTTGDISAFNTCRTAYIQCKSNTTYTVSRIVGTRFIIGTTTNTPTTGMVCNQYIANNTVSSLTITTGSNDNYLLVFYYNSGSDTLTEEAIRNSIMINEGSTALPYEPYGKVWYKTENIGKYTFIGNETGWQNSFGASLFGINLDSKKINASSNALSNYFVFHNVQSGINNNLANGEFTIQIGSTTDTLYIKNTDYTNVADFKTWLSTHNTTVLYQLATPKYTVITNTELIEQLEALNNAKSKDGTTNITITSEDLSMLLNVSVLKGE